MKTIGRIDQVLSTDVNALTSGVASLWNDVVKPLVDIAW